MELKTALDPVTLAVLRGRLEQVADEMDATLYRSAFNPIIAEAHDACHGIYDGISGDTLVQGKSGLPVFVGAMAFAVRAAAKAASQPSCEIACTGEFRAETCECHHTQPQRAPQTPARLTTRHSLPPAPDSARSRTSRLD